MRNKQKEKKRLKNRKKHKGYIGQDKRYSMDLSKVRKGRRKKKRVERIFEKISLEIFF